jgi:hypothetical protein
MLGGTEGPCVPEHFLAVIREREGRPCPQVELEPDNIVAANLFSLAISDHAALVPLWFETMAGALDVPEQRAVLSRVVQALMDGETRTLFRRPPDLEMLAFGSCQ